MRLYMIVPALLLIKRLLKVVDVEYDLIPLDYSMFVVDIGRNDVMFEGDGKDIMLQNKNVSKRWSIVRVIIIFLSSVLYVHKFCLCFENFGQILLELLFREMYYLEFTMVA